MNLFRNLPIGTKLLVCYLAVFIGTVTVSGALLYFSMRRTLEQNIESELSSSTRGILNMVSAAADASIRNHLRALAEANLEIVQYYWQRVEKGELTEAEAKAKATEVMNSQVIGTTGYIYALDSGGVVQVHSKKEMLGKDVSRHTFVQEQLRLRQGYQEYEWANPGEEKARSKAIYMVYFGPWDWIIAASSYRDEFTQLLDVSDFKKDVLAATFGQTGYTYIMDFNGLLLVHPKLEGVNIYNHTNSSDRNFIQQIIEEKNGKITYLWRNPGEPEAREKLVIFNSIPELGWIVASSGYLDEIYKPLHTVGLTLTLAILIMAFLTFPITWLLSASITKPLASLTQAFAKGASGNSRDRVEIDAKDEIGQLGYCYNRFMERLEESHAQLESSVKEYRSIFENAVEGIFQSTPDGRFLSVNPSMAMLFGYGTPEQMIHDVKAIEKQLYLDPNDRQRMIDLLMRQGYVFGFEVQLLHRSGDVIWISISTRGVFDNDGNLIKLEGFVSDISRKKELEQTQTQDKEMLEDRVRERTAELSQMVEKLERSNNESDQIRKMGELLQVCRSLEESYPLIKHFLSELFKGSECILYMREEGQPALARVFGADEDEDMAMHLDQDDCWALRLGKPHLVQPGAEGLVCKHLKSTGYVSLCLPLISMDELIGMLQIIFMKISGKETTASQERLNHAQRLSTVIADHLALALGNIQLRESLRVQSIQDPLTGLFNRRYMENSLTREIARAQRHKSPLSLLILDVDHFKNINDTYGHDVGDIVLRELGSLLKIETRTEDIVCRFGGEEFVIILVGADTEHAMQKAEKLRQGIETTLRVEHDNKRIAVTVSLGLAGMPMHGKTSEELLRNADQALYLAKKGGRNQVVLA